MDEQSLKVVLPADVSLVGPGTEVKGVDDKPYIVESRTLRVDAEGKLSFEIKLRAAKASWPERLDRLSTKHDWLPHAVAALAVVALAVPCLVVLLFLSQDSQVQLAWAGRAVASTRWIIFVGIGVTAVVATSRSRRLGVTLGHTIVLVSLAVGLALGELWRVQFVPKLPEVWPDDYAQLATDFGQRASSIVAIVAVYAPLILLGLKLLKLDSLREIAATIFRDRKSGE